MILKWNRNMPWHWKKYVFSKIQMKYFYHVCLRRTRFEPTITFYTFREKLPFVLLHILQRSRSQYYSSFIFIFIYLVRPNFSFGVIHHNKKCKKSIENIVLLCFLFAIPFYLMKGLPFSIFSFPFPQEQVFLIVTLN